MPVYEYACGDCAHRFDVRQNFGETPLSVCPNCGGSIRRVVLPVGIVFKGSGFYKTDSRSTSEAGVPAGERKTDSSPAPATDGAASSTESATPAKPAETTAAAKPADAKPVAAKPAGRGEAAS